jgi:hypothetical protein
MSHKIYYDRKIGPTLVSSGSDAFTTALTVTAETAPTAVTAVNYANLVFIVSSPGSIDPTVPATCTDTQGSSFTLVKEVKFAGYALDVFERISASVNVDTTITVSHQAANRRAIVCDEWYNLGSLEKSASAFASSAVAQVDAGEFRTGQKHWLTVAVLGIGGAPHGDSITIPDDWNLITDTGTNYGDSEDVRLVVCYQIATKRKKVDFRPLLGNPRVWGVCMFSIKEKL